MRTRLALAVLVVASLWAAPASATITFFGVAATPADSGSNATKPVTLTPPASMVVGDFVVAFLIDDMSNDSANMSVSTTGGQSWTACGDSITGVSQVSAKCFYTRYNGSWDADPAFTTSATGGIYSGLMPVFRPTASGCTWAVDNAGAGAAVAAATNDLTITGITRAGASSLALALWWAKNQVGDGGSTWSDLLGSGWLKTSLAAQYRNLAGGDFSGSLAYNIGTGATNNVSQDQSSSSVYGTWIGSFAETCPVGSGRLTTLGAGS